MKTQLHERAGLRDAAGPLCVSGADRQDHPRREFREPRRGRAISRPRPRRAGDQKPRAREICPNASQRREDRLFRRQRAQSDALLFQHQSCRRRRETQRLPAILRPARRRRQFLQERVLSDLPAAASTGCAISFSTAARRSFRTTPAFRWPISIRKNGDCSHSATISVRFPNFLVLPARDGGAVSQGQAHPDRFRARLPVANERIEPAGRAEDRARTTKPLLAPH